MAIELFRAATANLDRLRFAGTAKRVRGSRAGTPVVDTTDALLVWEPRHVVPEYAVPADAITVDLVEVTSAAEPDPAPPIVLPGSFEVHLTPGTSLAAASEGEDAPAIAFRPDDPDLHGHVILFSAFDWLEESEPIMGHPHDPFQPHRLPGQRPARGRLGRRRGRRRLHAGRSRCTRRSCRPAGTCPARTSGWI